MHGCIVNSFGNTHVENTVNQEHSGLDTDCCPKHSDLTFESMNERILLVLCLRTQQTGAILQLP